MIILLKGLPASGKSAWAKDYMKGTPKTIRVNKDLARQQFFFSHWTKTREKFVLKMRDLVIQEALNDGYTVIVDDTNLHPKHEERMKEIAQENGVHLEIKFFDAGPATCQRRNYTRNKVVPNNVIDSMYQQAKDSYDFIEYDDDVYEPDTSLPKAAIFDIDGTLATMTERSPYDYGEKLLTDELNEDVKRVLDFYYNYGYEIIIFTGRKESEYTQQWLKKHKVQYDILLQRDVDDDRKDSLVKKDMFDSIKDKYHIVSVYDDRDQVVSMWRSLGLQCFQVNYGSF